MSNEIINPYQTFYDAAGVPLANGTISFFTNTTTTLGTIYSDEALTVAQANPYTLDAYGRIIGDVKYTGLRTLLIKAELGATVRTIDNVATMFDRDTLDLDFTKNFATLAAAVADTGLKNGDAINLKERTSGNGGGAIWDAVLSSTVTEDTFDIVQCTGIGTLSLVLRAGDEINIKQIGAIGDNSTDNAGVINHALANYNAVYMPKGFYRITSSLTTSTGRVKIRGDGKITSQIIYRVTSTSENHCFDFDNIDTMTIHDLSVVCDSGSGSQQTVAFEISGGTGAVTDIELTRVDIQSFQKTGVHLENVNYVSLNTCRILSTSNAVANGGTGSGNAYAMEFTGTVNALNINNSRLSSNDAVMRSRDTQKKYALTVNSCYIELNGEGAPAAADTVALEYWNGVNWNAYMEANLTGTATADSALKLKACHGVNVSGGLLAGTIGGVGKSKNLIGISDNTQGVVIQGIEFQDPITKYVYVADGNSIPEVKRCTYDVTGTLNQTYASIMAVMTADLVQIDVPHLEAVTTGTIAAAGNYQANITITGIPTDRNCMIMATAQLPSAGSAADWNITATIVGSDTVRLIMDNIKGSNNNYTGNIAFRIFKNGSF